MNKTIENKINDVIRNRNEATKLVRNSLMNSCDELVSKINRLIEVYKDDKKIVDALNKEKELINSITADLLFAKSIDDIIKIRKRLNYIITKIRKEMSSRNYVDGVINDYNESIVAVRDDIKEYIRIFKRKDNLNNISDMNKEGISKEEKKQITHELSKERRFNKRVISKYTMPDYSKEYDIARDVKEIFYREEATVEDVNEIEYEEVANIINDKVEDLDVEEETEIVYDSVDEIDEVQKRFVSDETEIEYETVEEEKEDTIRTVEDVNNIEFDTVEEEKLEIIPNYAIGEETEIDYESIMTEDKASPVLTTDIAASTPSYDNNDVIYINPKMMAASSNYVIYKVKPYGKGTFNNIKNFVVNIPSYMHNKKIIRLMKVDFSNFYSGRDLKELISLSKKSNSVKGALEAIIRNSALGKKMDKNFSSYEKRQQQMYQLLDIIEEYNSHLYTPDKPEEFSYDKIKHHRMISQIEVDDGGIEYASIYDERLSTR